MAKIEIFEPGINIVFCKNGISDKEIAHMSEIISGDNGFDKFDINCNLLSMSLNQIIDQSSNSGHKLLILNLIEFNVKEGDKSYHYNYQSYNANIWINANLSHFVELGKLGITTILFLKDIDQMQLLSPLLSPMHELPNTLLFLSQSIIDFDKDNKKFKIKKSKKYEVGCEFNCFQLLDKPIKRVFISQPMNDKTEEEVLLVRKHVEDKLRSILGDDFELLDTYHQDAPLDAGRLYYLGGSIRAMDKVDLIYFTRDYKEAKGCKIEFMIANEYGLNYIVEED